MNWDLGIITAKSNVELHTRRTNLQFESIQIGKARPRSNGQTN